MQNGASHLFVLCKRRLVFWLSPVTDIQDGILFLQVKSISEKIFIITSLVNATKFYIADVINIGALQLAFFGPKRTNIKSKYDCYRWRCPVTP